MLYFILYWVPAACSPVTHWFFLHAELATGYSLKWKVVWGFFFSAFKSRFHFSMQRWKSFSNYRAVMLWLCFMLIIGIKSYSHQACWKLLFHKYNEIILGAIGKPQFQVVQFQKWLPDHPAYFKISQLAHLKLSVHLKWVAAFGITI